MALPHSFAENNNGGGSGSGRQQQLSTESLGVFSEGVRLVLSRWTALRIAVQEQWGGRSSLQKSEQLASDLIKWFTNAKPPLYIDDLETMLDDNMVLSFSAEIEDGSIEEVAEQIMIMHEGCLEGNYESVLQLRSVSSNIGSSAQAVSQSVAVMDEDAEGSSDEENERVPVNHASCNTQDSGLSTDVTMQEQPEASDGWTVIGTRRSRGRRSS